MNKWINKKILQADLLGFSLSLWKSQILCNVKSKSNFHIRKTTNKKSVDHAVIIGVENLCFFFLFQMAREFSIVCLIFHLFFFFLCIWDTISLSLFVAEDHNTTTTKISLAMAEVLSSATRCAIKPPKKKSRLI